MILQVLGVYLYRRRRHKYSTKNPGFEFDDDAFPKSASAPRLDKYMMADLTKLNSSVLSLGRPHHDRQSSSISASLGRRPEGSSPLRIVNVDEDEKISNPTLGFPRPVARKGKPSRCKPTWLSPIKIEQEVRSPPPAYDMLSVRQEMLTAIPPPQKSKAIPMTSTPSAIGRSYASAKSQPSSKSLVILDLEPVPIISPARSESFAPKDLILPSPPTPPASSTSGLGFQIDCSRVEHVIDVKPPRIMKVVALFTPNLPDELHVKVGDIVHIIEEYKDGWCFARYLGKKDAPEGVIPLVCLRERKGFESSTHQVSNHSLTSSDWHFTNR